MPRTFAHAHFNCLLSSSFSCPRVIPSSSYFCFSPSCNGKQQLPPLEYVTVHVDFRFIFVVNNFLNWWIARDYIKPLSRIFFSLFHANLLSFSTIFSNMYQCICEMSRNTAQQCGEIWWISNDWNVIEMSMVIWREESRNVEKCKWYEYNTTDKFDVHLHAVRNLLRVLVAATRRRGAWWLAGTG